jgi:hypothetical protein
MKADRPFGGLSGEIGSGLSELQHGGFFPETLPARIAYDAMFIETGWDYPSRVDLPDQSMNHLD